MLRYLKHIYTYAAVPVTIHKECYKQTFNKSFQNHLGEKLISLAHTHMEVSISETFFSNGLNRPQRTLAVILFLERSE